MAGTSVVRCNSSAEVHTPYRRSSKVVWNLYRNVEATPLYQQQQQQQQSPSTGGRVVTPQCRHQCPRRQLLLLLLKDFFRPEKEIYSGPMGTIAGYSATIQKRLPSLTNWPEFNDKDERLASANHSSRLHITKCQVHQISMRRHVSTKSSYDCLPSGFSSWGLGIGLWLSIVQYMTKLLQRLSKMDHVSFILKLIKVLEWTKRSVDRSGSAGISIHPTSHTVKLMLKGMLT